MPMAPNSTQTCEVQEGANGKPGSSSLSKRPASPAMTDSEAFIALPKVNVSSDPPSAQHELQQSEVRDATGSNEEGKATRPGKKQPRLKEHSKPSPCKLREFRFQRITPGERKSTASEPRLSTGQSEGGGSPTFTGRVNFKDKRGRKCQRFRGGEDEEEIDTPPRLTKQMEFK